MRIFLNDEYEEFALNILNYIDGAPLEITKPITGTELIHLMEIKNLIRLLKKVFAFLALAIFLSLSLAKDYKKIFLYGIILTFFIAVLLLILPFDFLFYGMHLIAFSPGTWIFPQQATLYKTYPPEFFNAMFYFLIGIIILLNSFFLFLFRFIY